MPARAADGRRHEVAACEAVAITLDDSERLVAEHERVLVVGRDPEETVHDLAIGPAHADLEHAHGHLTGGDRRRRHVLDARGARTAGLDDERLHRRTAPSDAGPTRARYRANTPPTSETGGAQSAKRAASSSSATSTV